MRGIALLVLSLSFCLAGSAKKYTVVSPDGTARAEISANKSDGIFAEIFLDDQSIFIVGPLQMDIEGIGVLGERTKVRKVRRALVDEIFRPVVREKRAEVRNNYAELSLFFKEDFRLDFRLFNDGFAYRFQTQIPGEIQVNNEVFRIRFADAPFIYFPTEESFFTHSERAYEHLRIAEIPQEKFASLPALVDREDGTKVLLTESHLEDYPGLYLRGSADEEPALEGVFPKYVVKEQLQGDRNLFPEERAEYSALTGGMRSFPWRVAAFSRHDHELISNDIVLRLAPECRIDQTDWIQPGMVSWDWWNANNNSGVNFRSGVNTETYKFHIDFAAAYGLPYVILDEGWSVPGDLFQINPDCDLEEITAYAQEKNVGIILWTLWNALDKDLDRALDQFAEWGVKGIKVDFMQRDDQQMVNYYWKVAKAAAARELLVDFHGSYKPSGIRGAYPNCVSREGLKGLENAKWSDIMTPDHDCTLPFIRMVAGPMDYTPGAMRNAQKNNYHISYTRPMSQGTRCHQLALYVVFESPLQMLCDAPAHYYREPVAMEFLAEVPTVWDETIPLFGQIGDYVGVARKSGDQWFIGVITDWSAREFDLDLSFLGAGDFQLIEFKDGINADRYAEDFSRTTVRVQADSRHPIRLAPGGGYAAIIKSN